MTEIPITPPLHGNQPPSPTPLCASLLLSLDGTPCSEPAVWHIRWNRSGDAGLACQPHMDQITAAYAWYDRHHASPACSAADVTWGAGRCAPAQGIPDPAASGDHPKETIMNDTAAARRALLAVLLDDVERGVLRDADAPLLRPIVAAEQAHGQAMVDQFTADAPWLKARAEDLAAETRRSVTAEATLDRVREVLAKTVAAALPRSELSRFADLLAAALVGPSPTPDGAQSVCWSCKHPQHPRGGCSEQLDGDDCACSEEA